MSPPNGFSWIDKPRLAAQTIVNTLANTHFETLGLAKLDKTYTLHVEGTVVDNAGETPGLKIALHATREQGAPLCSLDTKITAPPGHSVVLGVTPNELMTSAFVVQVLPRGSK
jgi:hypothetical protein